jgi:hypothetical protein
MPLSPAIPHPSPSPSCFNLKVSKLVNNTCKEKGTTISTKKVKKKERTEITNRKKKPGRGKSTQELSQDGAIRKAECKTSLALLNCTDQVLH